MCPWPLARDRSRRCVRLQGLSGCRLVHKFGVSSLEACDEIRSVLVKGQGKSIRCHLSDGILRIGVDELIPYLFHRASWCKVLLETIEDCRAWSLRTRSVSNIAYNKRFGFPVRKCYFRIRDENFIVVFFARIPCCCSLHNDLVSVKRHVVVRGGVL